MFDWTVNDHLRLRDGRNIANRAPNIGELFEAKTQIVGAGGSTLGDLCYASNTTGGALSANPALNPNAAQVRAMCEAQMGVTGSTAYYAPGNIPGVSTLGNRTGNPSLHSENGDTMTIGAVLNFAESVQISIDAYEITITDYIAAQLGESVLFNPTYSPFTAACNQILRDSWQLRYGIDNLLDEEPVFTNATRYTRGTTTLGGFYDVLGRRAYVGMSVNF